MSFTDILLAILCNVLWGTAIPFIKIGTKALEIPAGVENQFFFAGLRFFLSGVMLFIYSLLKEKKMPTIKKENRARVFKIMMLGTALQYGLMYMGLVNTKSADGNIFTSIGGFLTVLIAPLFFKDDKYTIKKLLGAALGFTGVLIVSIKGTGIHIALNGEFLLILSSLCFVLSSFATKKLNGDETGLNITAYNLLIGGLILLLIGLFTGGHFGRINAKGICALLYLALLSAMAFTIWAELLKRHKASTLGVFNLVNPIVGTILAALVVGEDLNIAKYALSLSLVSAGIIIINRQSQECKNS